MRLLPIIAEGVQCLRWRDARRARRFPRCDARWFGIGCGKVRLASEGRANLQRTFPERTGRLRQEEGKRVNRMGKTVIVAVGSVPARDWIGQDLLPETHHRISTLTERSAIILIKFQNIIL